ncbi:MAG: acyl carrier protein [Acetobacteraceae bacterium]|nr:acyl carrier protein [Acetobacteraceae bacterium]
MDHPTIFSQLTELFRDVFVDSALVLTPDATADDIPGWDSMTHITLVAAAEYRFGLKFRIVEIEELTNVGDFVSLIERKTCDARDQIK